MPGCPFPLLKTARQTVPNDPEPMTSSRVIRLSDISHLSTSATNVPNSSSSSTSVGLKNRNAEHYLKINHHVRIGTYSLQTGVCDTNCGLLTLNFGKMGLVRAIILNNWKEDKECYRIIHGNQ